jgi:hypothetical protein
MNTYKYLAGAARSGESAPVLGAVAAPLDGCKVARAADGDGGRGDDHRGEREREQEFVELHRTGKGLGGSENKPELLYMLSRP